MLQVNILRKKNCLGLVIIELDNDTKVGRRYNLLVYTEKTIISNAEYKRWGNNEIKRVK